MTKCDFCVHSDPKQGCPWTIAPSIQEGYCEDAIKRMGAALKNLGCGKREG